MADIRSYPLTRHLRGNPTLHVRHLRHGKLMHDGTGLSFFFRPLSAVLSEVPVDDRELPLLFHARTNDFQDLTVQASATFRVSDPATACARIDFSIDPDTGRWRGTPLEQVAGLLTETAQQQVLDMVAASPLASLLADGVARIRDQILHGLTADPRLAETGISVVGARVVALRPEPEVERALRTPTREQIQQDADRSTYERRALAVERERAIAENELQNKIELARREEQLLAQQGANARRQAEDTAAASMIAANAQADREQRLAEAKAAGTRALGEARAAGEAASVAAYSDLPQATLLALAAKELVGGLPQIGTLVLAPDILAPLLSRLAGGATGWGRDWLVSHADPSRRGMTLAPRAVLVHRRTELRELLERHGTRGQADFYLRTRNRRIEDLEARHEAAEAAIAAVTAAIPADWRRGLVERDDLSRFLFAPDDIIVVAGQDGLVANVAKYLDGQIVIGINPEPGRNPGVLVPHPTESAEALLAIAADARADARVEHLTMVTAVTDDGQQLTALNEIYIGQATHQTARYTLSLPGGQTEAQASSGLIVSTGTGATGWGRSAWLERKSAIALPSPADARLAWFVREAWPSPTTSTTRTEGELTRGQTLAVSAESDQLVVFGDGIEVDTLPLTWGQTATIQVAAQSLRRLRLPSLSRSRFPLGRRNNRRSAVLQPTDAVR